MQTKLTVRVESRSIANAKRFAAERGTTLSALIDVFLRRLPVAAATVDADVESAPVLQRLSGILAPGTDIEEYRRHLIEKYEH